MAKKKKEASAEERFWHGVLLKWKNDALDHRREYERYAQTYRSMYYPRAKASTGSNQTKCEDSLRHETTNRHAIAETLTANVVAPKPAVTIV